MLKVPYSVTVAYFAILGIAIFGWMLTNGDTLTGPPGSMGDDVHFENIAFNLARGEGVRLDFHDLDWRQPYAAEDISGQKDWIFFLDQQGLTTSRSPGFPLIVAGIYQVFGRNFLAVRTANLLLLAGSLAIMLTLVCRYHGYVAGTLALLTISLDLFVLRTAGQFMTEAIGTAIVCSVFSACMVVSNATELSKRGQILAWLAIGILFGVGMLVRANLNAWLLIIVACLGTATIAMVVTGRPWRPLVFHGIAFCVGAALIASPWWIRNCQVTGGFAPFGTSGSFGLVGAYCDAAYDDFGNWSIADSYALERKSKLQPGFEQLTLAQQEYRMGQDSTRAARKWATENWKKLPALMTMKALSHLGFYRQPVPLLWINGLMIFGAIIGCIATRKSTGFWLMAILLLSVVTTSLTWSHFGRYSIPIRPLIHVASAIGTVVFWTYVIRKAGFKIGAPKPTEN